MTTLLIIVHVLVSLFLIAIVLLQHGKGADIGATFGGSGQSVFGSEGPVPLLNKITTFSAIVFMGTSISLAYHSANESTGSIMKDLPVQETAAPKQKEAPVTIPMPAMPGTESQESKPVDQLEELAPELSSEEAVEPAVQDVAPEEEMRTTPAQVSESAEDESTVSAFLEEEEPTEETAPVEQADEQEVVPEQAE